MARCRGDAIVFGQRKVAVVQGHGAGRAQDRGRSRVWAVVFLVVVSLAAAACGSQVSTLGPVALTAYKATMAGGSANIATSFVERTRGGIGWNETSSGVFSWSSNIGAMSSQSSINTSVGKTKSNTTIETTEIIDRHKVFSQSSYGDSLGAGGGALGSLDDSGWTETSWSGKSESDLMGELFFGSPGPPNPGSLLQLLQSQALSISDLGPDLINGVKTKGYRAELPLAGLGGDKMSPKDLSQAEQMLGGPSVDIDFWLDSSQLLRRMSYVITIRTLPPAQGTEVARPKLPITLAVTLNASNYGVPVTVTPPPADQVTSTGTCQSESDGFSCQ
jgi:hypothetical protein